MIAYPPIHHELYVNFILMTANQRNILVTSHNFHNLQMWQVARSLMLAYTGTSTQVYRVIIKLMEHHNMFIYPHVNALDCKLFEK